MHEEFVRASEISDFCYCKRGWWLQIHNKLATTAAMQEGTKKHDHLAWRTQLFYRLQLAAYFLIALGIVSIVVYLLLKFYFHFL
ncbi:MAG: hypothetical protein ACREHC_03665 [Candidatus Levyibacteriota bacterium]